MTASFELEITSERIKVWSLCVAATCRMSDAVLLEVHSEFGVVLSATSSSKAAHMSFTFPLTFFATCKVQYAGGGSSCAAGSVASTATNRVSQPPAPSHRSATEAGVVRVDDDDDDGGLPSVQAIDRPPIAVSIPAKALSNIIHRLASVGTEQIRLLWTDTRNGILLLSARSFRTAGGSMAGGSNGSGIPISASAAASANLSSATGGLISHYSLYLDSRDAFRAVVDRNMLTFEATMDSRGWLSLFGAFTSNIHRVLVNMNPTRFIMKEAGGGGGGGTSSGSGTGAGSGGVGGDGNNNTSASISMEPRLFHSYRRLHPSASRTSATGPANGGGGTTNAVSTILPGKLLDVRHLRAFSSLADWLHIPRLTLSAGTKGVPIVFAAHAKEFEFAVNGSTFSCGLSSLSILVAAMDVEIDPSLAAPAVPSGTAPSATMATMLGGGAAATAGNGAAGGAATSVHHPPAGATGGPTGTAAVSSSRSSVPMGRPSVDPVVSASSVSSHQITTTSHLQSAASAGAAQQGHRAVTRPSPIAVSVTPPEDLVENSSHDLGPAGAAVEGINDPSFVGPTLSQFTQGSRRVRASVFGGTSQGSVLAVPASKRPRDRMSTGGGAGESFDTSHISATLGGASSFVPQTNVLISGMVDLTPREALTAPEEGSGNGSGVGATVGVEGRSVGGDFAIDFEAALAAVDAVDFDDEEHDE